MKRLGKIHPRASCQHIWQHQDSSTFKRLAKCNPRTNFKGRPQRHRRMQAFAVPQAKRSGLASQSNDANEWLSPSTIVKFVRCLRLLDLDKLADWPGITEHVFTSKAGQQNLQARIKAVEWSLYRLFEIYDPRETQTVGRRKVLSASRCCLLK